MLVMAIDVMSMAMTLPIGLGLEPAAHLQGFGLGVVEPGVEQSARRNLAVADCQDRRRRIELPEARLERGEVALGDQQPVGDGGLLEHLGVLVQRGVARCRPNRRARLSTGSRC